MPKPRCDQKPSRHGARWRVRVYDGTGSCVSESFGSEEEALDYIRGFNHSVTVEAARERVAKLERQLDEARAHLLSLENRAITVREALDQYEMSLRDKRRAQGTIEATRRKIGSLCVSIMDIPMGTLTHRQATELYRARTQALVRRGSSKRATPIADATHIAELEYAERFWNWAIKAKIVHANPWRDVERIGQPREGKEQLSAEESLRLHETLCRALLRCDIRIVKRALGAALALYEGFRAHEIVGLPVRFVFSDGSHLEIRKSKTRAGRRASRVPEELLELRAALARVRDDAVARAKAEGRDPLAERMLPFDLTWVRRQAHHFCREAGVPLVCAHALRGMQSTLATEGGETAAAVAAALGQTSARIAKKHYIDPATLHGAQAAQVARKLRVLKGGKQS